MIQPSVRDTKSDPRVSIVIISLWPREEFFQACESALAQSDVTREVLVYVDQDDDERNSKIVDRFPDARVIPVDAGQSYLCYRNAGFQDSRGDIVVWIDDDAYFTSGRSLEPVVRLFDEQPEMGAASLRYIEPHSASKAPGLRDWKTGQPMASFVGCAAAFRRSTVEEIGGLREFYIAYGEERDLALRLWAAGREIRYVDSPPLVHAVSANRNKQAQNILAVRNTILFDYLCIPHPYLIPRLCLDAFNLFRYKLSLRTIISRFHFVAAGFVAAFQLRRLRVPVSRQIYQSWRSLQRGGAEHWPADEIPAPISRSQTSGIAS